jgi:acetyltransferase-like isoleucine patch superfamily enzyme
VGWGHNGSPVSHGRRGRLVRRALRRVRPEPLRDLRVKVIYHQAPRLASFLRKRWAIFSNPHATIRFGKHVYAGPGFSVHAPYGGTFIVGDGVEFRRNFRTELGRDARVTIGSNSFLTYDVIITCNTTIEIGERCGLTQCTYVADGNHRYRDLTRTFRQQGYNYRPIKIEDDVVIHSKSTVVNSIGRRAIIGANAMVTKPIPPYCVAAGVPATVIDYYGPPGQEPPGWEPADVSARSD